MIEANFLEGIIVVPRFVFKELQQIADSSDPVRRARGRAAWKLSAASSATRPTRSRFTKATSPKRCTVDAKLVQLARALSAKLYTNDFNLGKIAELQSVAYVNINELAKSS